MYNSIISVIIFPLLFFLIEIVQTLLLKGFQSGFVRGLDFPMHTKDLFKRVFSTQHYLQVTFQNSTWTQEFRI